MRGMNMQRLWLYLLLLLLMFGWAGTTQAQEGAQIRITQVDSSAFPEMRVNFIAAAGDGTPLTDFSDLQLSENGTVISEFQQDQVAVGVELALVVDANASINQRDTGVTQTRREQVRDAIVTFAQQNMNPSQLDRVHLVVPNDSSTAPEFLTDTAGAIFANEVINKINFYVPSNPRATPLNDMLAAAIERLSASEGTRHRAIVLFTDGGLLNSQLDFPALVTAAQANHITFYAFILGARADANEIANVNQLILPTGGSYLHMPLPADAAPLFGSVAAFGQQNQLVYRSQLTSSGQHTITITAAGQSGTSQVNVTIEPPTVQVLLDNRQPIVRVAPEPDTPLAEIEPLSQLVVAQVNWPDNHPRGIAAATLLINGVEQVTIDSLDLDSSNRLQFTWDISQLDAGQYSLVIQVTDELNLSGQSSPLDFTVTIERPAAVDTVSEAPAAEAPASTVAATASETSTATNSGIGSVVSEQAGLIGIVLGILAIGFALFLVVIAFIFMRRRSAAPAPVAAPAMVATSSLPPNNADATQILMPAFAIPQGPQATLEALEYAAEHSAPIALVGNDITIGRDPAHAKVIFQDKSVSRLHARIRMDRGNYILVDEGSASGTYVNFERVGFTPQNLRDSDEIHIGRVRLRFKVAAPQGAMDDRTQIFDAPRGGRAAAPSPPPAPADDNMPTEYFMQQPGGARPPSSPPSQSPSSPQPPAGPGKTNQDPDDVSTQPFMPHQPKR